MNTGAREWDAETYDRVSDPQFDWGIGGPGAPRAARRRDGARRRARAPAASPPSCSKRLPTGRVIALDGSEHDDRARPARTSATGSEYVVADLAELELAGAGGRRLLDRDLPLGARSRQPLPAHPRRAARPADGWSPSAGARATSPTSRQAIVTVAARAGVRAALRGHAVMWNFATPEETEAALARRRLRGGPLLARGEAGHAPSARASSWRPSRWARTWPCCPRSCATTFVDAVIAELGEPLTLDYVRLNIEARSSLMANGSSCCPATASAPRSAPRPAACSDALGDVEITEHPIGGASIDAARDGAHRRRAGGLPRLGRRPALRGRRPEVGHDRSRRAPAGAGAARPAQGPGAVRQPPPGQAAAGAARRQPAEARADRGDRPAGRPRADRRHLLRRLRPRRRPRSRRLRLHGRGDRADRPRRLRRRPAARRGAGDLGGQGERARDLAALARDRQPVSADYAGRRAGPPAGGQRGHAARLAARPTST